MNPAYEAAPTSEVSDPELAQRHLDKAIAADNENFQALKTLGQLHEKRGNWTSAVEMLLQRLHSEQDELMQKIAAGEWDDSMEDQLGKAIAEAIDDFGPDFDEEGNPLEEGESDRIRSEEERKKSRASGDDSGDEDEEEDDDDEEEAA